MMDYESFRNEVIARFKDFLPDEYRQWEIQAGKVPKVNGYMESVNLMPQTGKLGDLTAVPNIYVEELYNYYQDCDNMDQVLTGGADYFVKGMNYIKGLTSKVNLDNPEEKIILTLVNSQENSQLLANVPNRSLMDLSIIYRIMVEMPESGFNSAIVTNELAEKFGLGEEELYDIAMENTPKLMPPVVDMACDDFCIVTNKFRSLGAAAMLYDHMLAGIAEEFGNNLYILPSSIHEVFAVPDYIKGEAELKRIVREANATVVKKNEILSGRIYFYERKSGKLAVI